jgi:hypothetical protein
MTRSARTIAAGCLLAACTRGAPPAPPTPARAPAAAPAEDDQRGLAEDAGAPGNDASAPEAVLAPIAARDADTPEARLARYRALWKSPRHRPAALDAPPRAARLAAGSYLCKVSREYRLRDCSVERTPDGRTFLEFSSGNLLGMRGVLNDAPGGFAFEGWLTDEQPFGCSHCQDRCIAEPGTCACDPLPADAVVECLKQPLHMTLRATGGGRYRGTLRYRVYFNAYVGEGSSRRPEGFEAKQETLEVELVQKSRE